MDEPNKITIEAYDQEAWTYIAKTPSSYREYHKPMLNWIDTALDGIDRTGTKILEIGSATSRDASYMRNKGYKVQVSDASQTFVDYLKANNNNALKFNALTDPVPGGYDLIFANAVAPHFTYDDMCIFLDKMTTALTPGERLAINVKQGVGDEWISEKLVHKRFIHYWNPNDIKNLLLAHNFKILFFETSVVGDLPNHKWINIVAEKA